MSLDEVTRVADCGLHSQVRQWVPLDERLAALSEELSWSVMTATTDMGFARGFAAAQPQSGQPPEAFLNRWITVGEDLAVLAGPRYRGRDPDMPFVGIDASSRQVTSSDLMQLRETVRDVFASFEPHYVALWSHESAFAWPDTTPDNRDLAGRLDDLRSQTVPPELIAVPAQDLGFYERYVQIHREHVEQQPEHAMHTRVETAEDLEELLSAGTLFEIRVAGRWGGLLAAEPGVQHGLRGFTVVELLLAPNFRGHGYGKHLSTLLSRQLPASDDKFLLGTINHANAPAYRSAIAAGRHDVGGEVIASLT